MAQEPESPSTDDGPGLAGDVKRGLLWSTVNSLVLRLGSVVLGMVLARLLLPAEFGVYAVGLTVQAVLLTLVDLGMSVDLVRAEDPEKRAPTVALLSLISSVILASLMAITASPVAHLLGAPDAANVIAVLAGTLVISGAGVVPYAKLQRDFEQKKLFSTSLVDFVVGTGVTVVLVVAGVGPLALALGRVAAQSCSTSLQFVLARVRPRFGFDREVARSAIAFGLPLAVANLLSWALLNIDNVVIARSTGAAALGIYVLAFNVSTWPISAIGQAVRGVSLAGFSRASREGEASSLRVALTLTWAAALLAGVLLAALANPLIELLYGHRWGAAAPVLAALGFFGAVRVVLDLLATYLMAHGKARSVLGVQIAWTAALVPAVIVGTEIDGIAGAGWAHLIVAVLVILPAYGIAVRHAGVTPRELTVALTAPLVAAAGAWLAAHEVAARFDTPAIALVLGGLAGCAVYGALSYRRIRALLPSRAPVDTEADHDAELLARRVLVDQPTLEGVT
jgi:PST family polysaccharide transporter